MRFKKGSKGPWLKAYGIALSALLVACGGGIPGVDDGNNDDDSSNRPDEDSILEATLLANEGIDLEEAMLESVYNNPQCLFLARGERTYGANATVLREDLKREECQSVYASLRRTMDWVGRTDTLQNETLPVLTAMMFGKPSMGRNLQRSNESPKREGFVELKRIQDSTWHALEKASQLDQELYQQTRHDFQMSQWINFEI